MLTPKMPELRDSATLANQPPISPNADGFPIISLILANKIVGVVGISSMIGKTLLRVLHESKYTLMPAKAGAVRPVRLTSS
jgi:hypothetical protein